MTCPVGPIRRHLTIFFRSNRRLSCTCSSRCILPSKGSNPYRTTELLKPSDYFENANSLRGNVYQVEGVILNALAQNPEKGRLFSISVTSESKKWPMPILFPAKLRQINLQKNQSYRAKVKVDDAGILVAEEIQKS